MWGSGAPTIRSEGFMKLINGSVCTNFITNEKGIFQNCFLNEQKFMSMYDGGENYRTCETTKKGRAKMSFKQLHTV